MVWKVFHGRIALENFSFWKIFHSTSLNQTTVYKLCLNTAILEKDNSLALNDYLDIKM